MELLCESENQVYDYNNPASWRLLLAKTHVTEDIAITILQLLADLGTIDPELHKAKIIWSQNLIDNLELVYRRRVIGTPEKPVNVNRNPQSEVVSVNRNNPPSPHTPYSPKTKLNKTKLNKTKQNETETKQRKGNSISQKFDTFWKAYPKRKSKGQAEKAFVKINPDEQLLAIMLATIERGIKSTDWQKDGGKFIPYPATWLNAKGWEDEFSEKEVSLGKAQSRELPKTYNEPY